ncbi:MAG: HAD-IC family P-type ATPase [Candidatus Saccharibacteria bacterium]|nr:HAD-IC family P-type ATPase [Candidatus Saccharibacteria bacterium]
MTIWKIILKNTFTLFNLVNLILAAMVFFVGSYKNMLFIGIAIANTLISIVNEIRAKKIVDKMRLISEKNPIILKNNQPVETKPEKVEKGDLALLSLGDQVLFDSVVEDGVLEVNESFITGEQENILKNRGDELISGSFVVAGSAKARVKNIGTDNFVNKLEQDAKTIKTADSKLFKLMNNIVKYISYALIPIGTLLLWSRFRVEANPTDAVTSTVAALINMIPEGLILLTSSALALSTMRLSKKKVLVQDLYSIETLARVDCICLDKTGTLTTGNMTVKDLVPAKGTTGKTLQDALELILSHVPTDNATGKALGAKFAREAKNRVRSEIPVEVIPFSSDRKYSGIKFKDTELNLGALEFISKNKEFLAEEKSLKGIYRVLAVVKKVKGKETLLGFVRLEDEIRHDAKEIVNYFYDNNIDIKIISGDDLKNVTNIAKIVGVKNLNGLDLSEKPRPNYKKLVKEYGIFTRVTPNQKKELIKALKNQGNTVAMTGDGVNDILAMKEADCSIAIGDGSDAARRASKLVLLKSDFSAIPSIINEGRQTINNLERSATLFLAKTVYASILAVIFVILPFSYPFSPIEMSLLNFVCIGFPGAVLALEKNTDRVKDRFARNIVEYSVPIGLTVSIAMLVLSISSEFHNFSRFELTTTSLFITFAIDLVLIFWISRPLNTLRTTLLLTIIGVMAAAFFVPLLRDFFEFTFLTKNGLLIVAAITGAAVLVFELIRHLTIWIAKKTYTLSKKSPR